MEFHSIIATPLKSWNICFDTGTDLGVHPSRFLVIRFPPQRNLFPLVHRGVPQQISNTGLFKTPPPLPGPKWIGYI